MGAAGEAGREGERVTVLDPVTLAAVVGVMAASAAAASFLPGRWVRRIPHAPRGLLIPHAARES